MNIDERIDKLQNRLEFLYDKDIAFQIDMLKAIRDAKEEINKEAAAIMTEDNKFSRGKFVGYNFSLNILDKHVGEVESKYE